MKTLPLLFHAVILLLAIGITITVVLISVRRRSAPGATSLIVFALALIIWAISDFLYSSLSENSALLQLKPKIEGTLAVDFDKGSANGCVS